MKVSIQYIALTFSIVLTSNNLAYSGIKSEELSHYSKSTLEIHHLKAPSQFFDKNYTERMQHHLPNLASFHESEEDLLINAIERLVLTSEDAEQASFLESSTTSEGKVIPSPTQPLTVFKKLGNGTQGCVYLAKTTDPATGQSKNFALKNCLFNTYTTCVNSEDQGYYSQVQVPFAEIYSEQVKQPFSKLQTNTHLNINAIQSFWSTNNTFYTVLDYHPYTINKLLNQREEKRFSHLQVRSITMQLLAASSHLLELYIVHKDIRPDNLLVAENQRRVVLTDFDMIELIPEDKSTDFPCVSAENGHINNISPATAKELLTYGKATPIAVYAAAIAANHIELRTGQKMKDTFFSGIDLKDTSQYLTLLNSLQTLLHNEDQLAEKITEIFTASNVSLTPDELNFLIALMKGHLHTCDLSPYIAAIPNESEKISSPDKVIHPIGLRHFEY